MNAIFKPVLSGKLSSKASGLISRIRRLSTGSMVEESKDDDEMTLGDILADAGECINQQTGTNAVNTSSITISVSDSESDQCQQPTHPYIGVKVNQYVVEGVLGHGAEAIVLHARDSTAQADSLQCKVAFRILPGANLHAVNYKSQSTTTCRRLSIQNKNLNSLRTELAILRRIDHPTLVGFLEVLDLGSFKTKDAEASRQEGLCIVMELCTGPELVSDKSLKLFDEAYWAVRDKHDVQQHKVPPQLLFPERECADIFVQILAGLEYLHRNDVLHGDIKPSNILYDQSRKRVKLIDFGVSKVIDPESRDCMQRCHNGFGRGTFIFFSPESCKVEGTFCAKAADVWAAALSLYIILKGHLPFHALKRRDELLEAIRSPDPLLEMAQDDHNYHGVFASGKAAMTLVGRKMQGVLHLVDKNTMESHRKNRVMDQFLAKLLDKDPARRLSKVPDIMQHTWLCDVMPTYLSMNEHITEMPLLRSQLTEEEIECVAAPVWGSTLARVVNQRRASINASLNSSILSVTDKISEFSGAFAEVSGSIEEIADRAKESLGETLNDVSEASVEAAQRAMRVSNLGICKFKARTSALADDTGTMISRVSTDFAAGRKSFTLRGEQPAAQGRKNLPTRSSSACKKSFHTSMRHDSIDESKEYDLDNCGEGEKFSASDNRPKKNSSRQSQPCLDRRSLH